MNKDSWIIACDDRRIGGLLSAARKVSQQVTAVVIGDSDLAQKIAVAGFDKVLLFEKDDDVPAEALAGPVADLATQMRPRLVLTNDSPSTRIIAGTVAGALDAAVIGAVAELKDTGDALVLSSEIANAKALEDVSTAGHVVGIYTGPDSDAVPGEVASVETIAASPTEDRIIGTAEAGGSGLANSLRVVGVGMGIQSKDDLSITDELARVLGAEIACTLPACDDMHWYPSDRVLGSSHNQASPELYIAVGISGSPNHTSGFRDAKVVVSINNNPDAEIFHCSKYAVVGDLYKIVPALSAALA